MPKLNKTQQKTVEKAEAWGDGSFQPLEVGRYAARLAKVESRLGPKGEYWSWEFDAIHDVEGNAHGGRLWHTTSLGAASAGSLKSTFEAFGYSVDSDTDEMIGEWATLSVDIEMASQGKRAGQRVNRVRGVAEFIPSEFDFDVDDVPPVGAPRESANEPAF